ncbi:hypothetical protein IV203_035927 [Nitzschia inconspicua]|uniref:PCI domain-containing protein n=1 Tax=Nitzschia inconspicua TaxID=303405 RepID=A0A9K3LFX3_9STRA|nr:hypothetical protein IV203_035927 [Nitzschia inconspicua]
MNDNIDSATIGLLDTTAAMQPFLNVVKEDRSLNVSTVRSLVIKILAHPEIFCGFDQFKAAAQSALEGDTVISNTLDLFSYGTLTDFSQKQQDSPDFYLPLNESALTKLGQLTVLSKIEEACFHGNLRISYSSLAESLGWISLVQIPSDDSWIRNVEDILIRCVYANVLKGKLCQKSRSFGWEHESLPVVCSRDVNPERIPHLLAALQGLGQRLEASEKEVSLAQRSVTKGLTEADIAMNIIKSKQAAASAESHSGKGRQGVIGQGLGFDFGSGGGGATGRSARASNKRSRGGGSFANESAFRM